MTELTRTLRTLLLCVLLPPAACAAMELPGNDQAVRPEWVEGWQARSGLETDYVNRLALSDSAYLFQHADNPIDWYPWSDAAFRLAAESERLILLSIGYASCHWCHVMEKESFSDTGVARLLNEAYVSVKVDREQHPELDAWYKLVVEAVQGDSGWPVTIILTPEKEPVFAANYLNRDQFVTTIERYRDLWQVRPGSLRQSAKLLQAEVEQRYGLKRDAVARFDPDWQRQARARVLGAIDPVHGGIGSGNKFPNEPTWLFLLDSYKTQPNAALREELVRQLDRMMHSGLVDVLNGGVFRYTIDREMTRPHFEKMLYNQALTVSLYSDAADWLDRPGYRAFAKNIVEFVNRQMRAPSGGFAAALDADFKGVEGGYYLWAKDDLAGLPDPLGTVAIANGGQYLFSRAAIVDSADRWLQTLRAARPDGAPRVDNVITAWNALWISGLIRAGRGNEAERAAASLWDRAWSGESLSRMGASPGYLDDYAYFSAALWQLHLLTGQPGWKKKARLLDEQMLRRFYAEGHLYLRDLALGDQPDLDLYPDTELPSAAAAAIRSFSYHQTELKFIEAYERLRAGANAAVGSRPERHLSLLRSIGPKVPAESGIIAQGHGVVILRANDSKGHWRLNIGLDEGWHVNASQVLDKNLTPTRIASDSTALDVLYPEGDLLKTAFADQPLLTYSGNVIIDFYDPGESAIMDIEIGLQACSDKVCLLPERRRLRAVSRPAARPRR